MERYHTFWQRFWAGVVDGFVFLPLSIADGYLSNEERGVFVLVVWTLFFRASFLVYSVLMHARFGQTLGKMAMRIKVMDVGEDRTPTLREAVMRDIGWIVMEVLMLGLFFSAVFQPGFDMMEFISSKAYTILALGALAWMVLELVTMLTNAKRRALHDFIAGTVVVRVRGELPPRYREASG